MLVTQHTQGMIPLMYIYGDLQPSCHVLVIATDIRLFVLFPTCDLGTTSDSNASESGPAAIDTFKDAQENSRQPRHTDPQAGLSQGRPYTPPPRNLSYRTTELPH